MKYVIGALQWKLPRAPVPFNPALGLRGAWHSAPSPPYASGFKYVLCSHFDKILYLF